MLATLGFAWLALVVAQVSPGPNMVAVAATGMTRGRRDALFLVLGLACGMLLWSATTAAGLSALIQAFPQSLIALKMLGGSYLLYLGVKSARSISRGGVGSIAQEEHVPSQNFEAWRKGLLVVLTNPKAALMWAAVGAFLLGHGLSAFHVLALGPLGALSGVVIYGVYAWLFTTEVAMNGYSRFKNWVEGAFAIIFGTMGASLLLSAMREMRD